MRKALFVLLLPGALLVAACGAQAGEPTGEGASRPTPESDEASGSEDAGDAPPAASSPPVDPEDASPPEDAVDPSAGDGGLPVSACSDPGDPGGTEATARKLATITDDDGNSNLTDPSGAIGMNDVDVYTFDANDTAFHKVNPEFTTTGNVETCFFVECKSQGGSVSCGKNTTAATLGSKSGCCTTGAGSGSFSIDCPGTNDSVSAVLRIRGTPAAGVCEKYSIDYHF